MYGGLAHIHKSGANKRRQRLRRRQQRRRWRQRRAHTHTLSRTVQRSAVPCGATRARAKHSKYTRRPTFNSPLGYYNSRKPSGAYINMCVCVCMRTTGAQPGQPVRGAEGVGRGWCGVGNNRAHKNTKQRKGKRSALVRAHTATSPDAKQKTHMHRSRAQIHAHAHARLAYVRRRRRRRRQRALR